MFILVNYCQFWLNTNPVEPCLVLLIPVNRSPSCPQAPASCSAPSSWWSYIWSGSSIDGRSCGVTLSPSLVRAASHRCPHGPLRPPRRTNRRHSCELTTMTRWHLCLVDRYLTHIMTLWHICLVDSIVPYLPAPDTNNDTLTSMSDCNFFKSIKFYFNTTHLYKVNSGVLTKK